MRLEVSSGVSTRSIRRSFVNLDAARRGHIRSRSSFARDWSRTSASGTREHEEERRTNDARTSIATDTDRTSNRSTVDTLASRGTSTARLESVLSIETVEGGMSAKF